MNNTYLMFGYKFVNDLKSDKNYLRVVNKYHLFILTST